MLHLYIVYEIVLVAICNTVPGNYIVTFTEARKQHSLITYKLELRRCSMVVDVLSAIWIDV